jgi:hypothetical protein
MDERVVGWVGRGMEGNGEMCGGGRREWVEREDVAPGYASSECVLHSF